MFEINDKIKINSVKGWGGFFHRKTGYIQAKNLDGSFVVKVYDRDIVSDSGLNIGISHTVEYVPQEMLMKVV